MRSLPSAHDDRRNEPTMVIEPRNPLSELRCSPTSASTKKTRRERLHIELASDQPLTTEGKPRARVFVACLQCRTRKIRCDGAKPSCYNCTHCAKPSGPCSYDAAPKRRGPDKTPGARKRISPGSYQDKGVPAVVTRRRRKEPSLQTQPLCSLPTSVDPIVLPKQCLLIVNPQLPDAVPSTSTLALSLGLTTSIPFIPTSHPVLRDGPLDPTRTNQDLCNLPNSSNNSSVSPPVIATAARVSNFSYQDHDANNSEVSLTPEPSLHFTRQTWWDSLLTMYSSSLPTPTSISKRQWAAHQITSDLRFLFRHSNYWLSFINVPRFFSIYFDPRTRPRMQPSFLIAALAVATFFQSSEAGLGKDGRRKAIDLRDIAQGALEASLNARWINEELAQAAWLLAMFEVCAHPNHTSERCSSSLVILDTIIRILSLTLVDVEDSTSTKFFPRSVPSVLSPSPSWVSNPSLNAGMDNTHSRNIWRGCSCISRSLNQHSASANEYTPLWLSSPAWDQSWSESEIKKETCRRLCWSTLLLTAGHTSYVTSANRPFSDLFVLEPANIALLFPGEAMHSADSHSGKDTIWSLNYRTILLWNSCLRMRHNSSISEAYMARFALDAWSEADFLEQALDSHECDLERTFLFQGREYLFNVRFMLTHEFQRCVPLTPADINNRFRKKAVAWLTHQANVAEHVVQSLGAVTGHASHTIVHRPFFAFWFMSQISRALHLWKRDNSLTLALGVGAALFKPVDYLSTLWPCSEQRRRSQIIREELAAACRIAGRPLGNVGEWMSSDVL